MAAGESNNPLPVVRPPTDAERVAIESWNKREPWSRQEASVAAGCFIIHTVGWTFAGAMLGLFVGLTLDAITGFNNQRLEPVCAIIGAALPAVIYGSYLVYHRLQAARAPKLILDSVEEFRLTATDCVRVYIDFDDDEDMFNGFAVQVGENQLLFVSDLDLCDDFNDAVDASLPGREITLVRLPGDVRLVNLTYTGEPLLPLRLKKVDLETEELPQETHFMTGRLEELDRILRRTTK